MLLNFFSRYIFQNIVYFHVKTAPPTPLKNHSPIFLRNSHLKTVIMYSLPRPFSLKIWWEIQRPSRNGEVHPMCSWHRVLIWSLKNPWVLGFNCVLLIIKIAGLETSKPTFLGEGFGMISWNRLIIFNGDMKWVLLISFLVQNLITSDNPISMWLWWIWNSAFWLEVENLRKIATIVSYKPLPSLSQENRTTLPSALLDTSTT